MYTHFYFVDIFPTEHMLFVKRVLIGCSYHAGITKIRLTMPKMTLASEDALFKAVIIISQTSNQIATMQ
jgi:hypothetical protein